MGAVGQDLALAGLSAGDRVLVACSGGADSLALAAALARHAGSVGRSTRKPGFRVTLGAVIVDHGLFAGSAQVAQQVAAQCRHLGLDFAQVCQVEVAQGAGSGGLEAAARHARYQALDQAAAHHQAAAVYLGHTVDDQAEQVLLSLARGSGTRALAGIAPVRGIYRRPLLGVGGQAGLGLRRADTLAACEHWGLDPWQDPSNAHQGAGAPLRNRVRHELLPVLHDVLGADAVVNLARSASIARQDADALDALAASLLDEAVIKELISDGPTSDGPTSDDPTAEEPISGESICDTAMPECACEPSHKPAPGECFGGQVTCYRLDPLMQAAQALRVRALKQAAWAHTGHAITSAHVDALNALTAKWQGQGPVFLPGGVQVTREYGRLVFRTP